MHAMRQGEPNPLQRELARGQQVGAHPDADLLTAFAEGSLLDREREEMFAHLATCRECREVMTVAMGTAESPVSQSKPFLVARPTPAPLRKWIPWASIAAGIVLVSTVGLVYRHRMESNEPAAAEKLAGNTAEISAENQSSAPHSAQSGTAMNATVASQTKDKLKRAKPFQEAAPTGLAGMTNGGAVSAGAATDEPAKQLNASEDKVQADSANALATLEEAAAVQQPQVGEMSQAGVEAQAKSMPAPPASFVASEPARALNKSSLAAIAPRPRWRINNMGIAERSIGAGEWQKLFPDGDEKMRVVSVINGEVWVGGDNTRLYHSSDNGNTWHSIPLPTKGSRYHAIVHISFKTQQEGTVEAEDGTSWATTDGGVSWK
jgi:hypothetical protein